jgi:hypothetical protein
MSITNYSQSMLKTIKAKTVVTYPTNWILAIVFSACIPIFFHLTFFPTSINDFGAHIQFIVDGANHSTWPPHFLYHYVTYLLSLGSESFELIALESILVLTTAVMLKAFISNSILKGETDNNQLTMFFCLSLLLVMPMFNWWHFPEVYLGQLTPNVWHNPTTIFVTPLAICLFYVSKKALQDFNFRDFGIASLLLVLNAVSKPNYLLAFAPVFAIAFFFELAIKLKRSQITFVKGITSMLILMVPISVILYSQFANTYGAENPAGAGIILAPFKVWSMYCPNIGASLLLSTAFPLTFSIAYFNKVKGDIGIIYSWLVFAVAVLQFTLFAESGSRLSHGNFAWGSFVALYILFLSCTASFLNSKKSAKFYIIFAIYLLHLISGIYYLSTLVSAW